MQDTGAADCKGTQDAFGTGAATLTGSDGVDQTTFGTINIDLVYVVDARTGDAARIVLTGGGGADTLTGGGGAIHSFSMPR
ncbi:hypothetical protein ABMC88_10250 [Sulfitobacter sp. HNIBRBA2951]|uniref:hypothetical protein n=1 Tax=Sulfitobacter aquimarinus TaxID=3158557 RepID=UPI0032DF0CDB